MQKLNISALLTIVATLLLSPLVVTAGEKGELIFGVHPYLHATTLVERFTPLTEYLGYKLNQQILIRVATSYQDHINAISQGDVDFAYMGPASYIKLAEENHDHTLLGRLNFSGKDIFRGAIIIRIDSPLTSLSQLQGKRFAFGDPNSTLSSKVPQRLLADAGIYLDDLDGYSHLKNHHNVALAVLLGKYNAGGVKEEIFHEYESRGLRVLEWTPYIPTNPFVASSRMAPEQISKLRQLLLTLHNQPYGLSILKKIKKGTTAIMPANGKEYELLRDLIASPDKSTSTN
ncbi:MAG: phosphate/phosphite/phosphonate ABC transporter substrate-binding protein [Gammaproteobacteria bacterium]|nr:phosphate/phosphite/phosphonate ABC transporter substrate-binding protein [Gammaproteobacteria bacterium]